MRDNSHLKSTFKTVALIAFILLAASCNHNIRPTLPVTPPQHEIAYRAGLDAFRLGTPEAYQRAAESFRRAAALDRTHCEYSLALAESLLSLAQEQKLNWENIKNYNGFLTLFNVFLKSWNERISTVFWFFKAAFKADFLVFKAQK